MLGSVPYEQRGQSCAMKRFQQSQLGQTLVGRTDTLNWRTISGSSGVCTYERTQVQVHTVPRQRRRQEVFWRATLLSSSRCNNHKSKCHHNSCRSRQIPKNFCQMLRDKCICPTQSCTTVSCPSLQNCQNNATIQRKGIKIGGTMGLNLAGTILTYNGPCNIECIFVQCGSDWNVLGISSIQHEWQLTPQKRKM